MMAFPTRLNNGVFTSSLTAFYPTYRALISGPPLDLSAWDQCWERLTFHVLRDQGIHFRKGYKFLSRIVCRLRPVMLELKFFIRNANVLLIHFVSIIAVRLLQSLLLCINFLRLLQNWFLWCSLCIVPQLTRYNSVSHQTFWIMHVWDDITVTACRKVEWQFWILQLGSSLENDNF